MTERTPSTEAGKSLLADVHGDDHGFGYDIDRDAILAIEAEAESSLRARLAAEVETLRTHHAGGYEMEWECTNERVPDPSFDHPTYCPDPYEAHCQLVDSKAVLQVIKGQEPPRA